MEPRRIARKTAYWLAVVLVALLLVVLLIYLLESRDGSALS